MQGNEHIFIISQPRAGSTLLQSLLSNNTYVNTVSEPWILLGLAPLLRSSLVLAKYDYNIAIDAISQIESQYDFKIANAVKRIADDYYNQLLKGGYQYVLDKTPRYYEILHIITRLYPQAKIIILKRNPVDVVLSLIKKRNIVKASNLLWNNRDLLNAPYLMQEFLENHKSSASVIQVRYEDLISTPEAVISSLYDAVKIPFTKDVLQLATNKKVQGKYGDQNIQSADFSTVVEETSKPSLTGEMEEFIQGYTNFLGKDFLQRYGTYSVSNLGEKATRVFDDYLHEATIQNENFDRSIYNKFKKA